MDEQNHTERPNFLDDFPLPTSGEWEAAALATLNGKPLESLMTRTYEGIDIRPIYRPEDRNSLPQAATIPGRPPFMRGPQAAGYIQRPWIIAQELAYASPSSFNQALCYDLERGQTAVNLPLDSPTRTGKDPDQAQPGEVGAGGVSLATIDDMAQALDGVDLAKTPLFIQTGTVGLPVLALLVACLRRQGHPTTFVHGSLDSDPLGTLAEEATLPLSLAQAYYEMAHVTRWAITHAPNLATIAVHSAPYHMAGADAVTELAISLATGVAYLRAMGEQGIDASAAAPRIRFDYAIGGHFFMEVAKLRAARVLWSQAVAAFGGDDNAQQLRLHGHTSRRNKTLGDIYTNMLRGTTEALAAAVGGVDSLQVAPFDEALGPPDDFSRRIARNVQIILQEEAHLTRVIDPAGGAYAVEALTDQLARQAWALFQTIESQGGMLAALTNGFIQAHIAAVAQKRASNLATRRDVMVGINQFTDPTETIPAAKPVDHEAIYRERASQLATFRADANSSATTDRLTHLLTAAPDELVEAAIDAAASATLNEITRTLRLNDQAQPNIDSGRLPPVSRAAEPFEALRRQVETWTAAYGLPPRIFLANLGPPRLFKARADFSQAFFEVGGFEVVTNNGFATPEVAAAAATESRAPAVVVCSTDETYPELVPPLVTAIKARQPGTTVILAGRPPDQIEALRAAGIDAFIYLGADCLATNQWLMERISEGK